MANGTSTANAEFLRAGAVAAGGADATYDNVRLSSLTIGDFGIEGGPPPTVYSLSADTGSFTLTGKNTASPPATWLALDSAFGRRRGVSTAASLLFKTVHPSDKDPNEVEVWRSFFFGVRGAKTCTVTAVTGEVLVIGRSANISSTGPPRVGDLSATVGGLTGTSTGTASAKGVSANTLAAATASGTGAAAVKGVSAKTLVAATASGTATNEIKGTSARTLGVLTSTGSTGKVAVAGVTARMFGDLTLTAEAAGIEPAVGELTATLGDLSGSGTGTAAPPHVGGYRYYRFYIPSALYVREVEMFASINPPAYMTDSASDLTLGRGAYATANASNTGTPAMAFDDGPDDGDHEWGVYTTPESWLKMDFGAPTVVGSLNVKFSYLFGPIDVFFQGSDDDSAWTTLHTFAGATTGTYSASGLALGSPLTGTSIGTSSSYLDDPAFTRDKVFDGDTSSFLDTGSSTADLRVWSGLALGTAAKITALRYFPRPTFGSRMTGGIFQGSAYPDFRHAIDLHVISGTPSDGWSGFIPISEIRSFAYVRYLAPAGGYGNVAEVEFYGEAQEASPTPSEIDGTVIGSTGSYSGTSADDRDKAFDNDIATFFDWHTASGSWVGLDFGTTKVIDRISYVPRNDYAMRMVGGIFQGTNDGTLTSWSDLATITDKDQAENGNWLVISSASATPYRYVRYLSPALSYGDVAELMFWGVAPTGAGAAGDLDQTLGDLTSAGSGAVLVRGILDSTIDRPTLATTSVANTIVSAAITLGAVTSTATGAASIVGTSARTLAGATVSSAGIAAATGVVSVTPGGAIASAAGKVSLDGVASPTVGGVTLATTSGSSTSVSANITLGGVSSVSTGSTAIVGASDSTLGTLTNLSTGAAAVQGTSARTLSAMTGSSTGLAIASGVSSPTFGTLTISSSGKATVAGATDATIGPLLSAGGGTVSLTGSASIAMGHLALSATSSQSYHGEADVVVGGLTLTTIAAVSNKGTAAATLGAATLSATAGRTALSVSVDLTLGGATATSTGKAAVSGTAAITPGDVTLSVSAGAPPNTGSAFSALGALTFTAEGAAAIKGTSARTLSGVTAASAGQAAAFGSLNVTVSSLTLSAAGKLPLRGSLTGTIGGLQLGTSLGSGVSLQLTVTMGAMASEAAGVVRLRGLLLRSLSGVSLSSTIGIGTGAILNRSLGILGLAARGSVAITGNAEPGLDGVTLSLRPAPNPEAVQVALKSTGFFY